MDKITVVANNPNPSRAHQTVHNRRQRELWFPKHECVDQLAC
jgi:hypothetical protein